VTLADLTAFVAVAQMMTKPVRDRALLNATAPVFFPAERLSGDGRQRRIQG
jgi:hypothetical protein